MPSKAFRTTGPITLFVPFLLQLPLLPDDDKLQCDAIGRGAASHVVYFTPLAKKSSLITFCISHLLVYRKLNYV